MRYEIAPLFCRPWTLNGITPRLIESHYENNYGAAVKRLNAIWTELDGPALNVASVQMIHRLKQEEASALNSALLHELYFASLGGDGRVLPTLLAEALSRDFGSVDLWRNQFVALAEALAGGSGWVLLAWLPRLGRLINQSVTDTSPPIAGAIPILALDMFEHAFHIDFGPNASAYVAAFMRNIEWNAVRERYEDALSTRPPRPLEQKEFADLPSVSADDVNAMLRSGAPVQIIDVRPRHYSSRASDIMDGAVWRDPERVDEWMGEFSKDTPIITYCVYGFHIGCQTAEKLRKAGYEAQYMAGGHSAWKAIEGPVKLFPTAVRPDAAHE
ncbi:Mn superoxide dismutase [alpha proteobacterium U9-1i]|nr:Mn superoxide dismutase [alpha proteobacterium U9-1i]